MDYNTLLELAVSLGYELAMAGAETFRVEESVNRVLGSYGVQSECFAIPNNLIVSIETPEGIPMTRMRRISYHGNDMDSVEQFSGLSRAICNRKPEPQEAFQWLDLVRSRRRTYTPWCFFLGDFLGAAGFAIFFGGNWIDFLCSGLCGILIGIVGKLMDTLKTNPFFSTIASAFLMAILAYALGAANIACNPDTVTIGALMILVPGLLFINAMRDIIFGDTNSGMNRIVQVFLIAVAIALGTAAAWRCASWLWGTPTSAAIISHSFPVMCIATFTGCIGFAIVFNIHGPGMLLCALGGVLAWVAYDLALRLGGTDLAGYFWGAAVASAYSEIMARIRKFPAITYLVISIFPLLPGAGVYYTMYYAVQGQMERFAEKGMQTAAIAGIMAVGILLVSTTVRLYSNWKTMKKT